MNRRELLGAALAGSALSSPSSSQEHALYRHGVARYGKRRRRRPGIDYALAGEAPLNWLDIEIVDLETGEVVEYVKEVDTIEGWVRVYCDDANGRPEIEWETGQPQTELVYGRYAIRKRK